MQGLSPSDLLAYERQIAMSKMGGVHPLLHPQMQLPIKQGSMGMGAAGASQAIYDGGFQNAAAAHQLMYYQWMIMLLYLSLVFVLHLQALLSV